MAFGAFAGRADQRGIRLVGFDSRPLPIDHKSSDNQRESYDDRDKDSTKRHGSKWGAGRLGRMLPEIAAVLKLLPVLRYVLICLEYRLQAEFLGRKLLRLKAVLRT